MLDVLVCSLEDVVGVFPNPVREQLLLAICASPVVVGPAGSGFHYLGIQP
jgi:hypothetical protein